MTAYRDASVGNGWLQGHEQREESDQYNHHPDFETLHEKPPWL